MITLLIVLIVACIILWAARALITAFNIEQPFATVIYVVIVLIVLIWILQNAGFRTPGLQ